MSTPAPSRPLMTIKQAATYLAVHEQYVRLLLRSGKLPGVKLGSTKQAEWRIHPEDLESYVASLSGAPAQPKR